MSQFQNFIKEEETLSQKIPEVRTYLEEFLVQAHMTTKMLFLNMEADSNQNTVLVQEFK